jgi:hypothetical protein
MLKALRWPDFDRKIFELFAARYSTHGYSSLAEESRKELPAADSDFVRL